jgi:hypothetical protein
MFVILVRIVLVVNLVRIVFATKVVNMCDEFVTYFGELVMNMMVCCAWWIGARGGWQELGQGLPWRLFLFFWKTFRIPPRLKGCAHALA